MNSHPSYASAADEPADQMSASSRRSFLQRAAAVGIIGAGLASAKQAIAGPTNPNALPNLYRGWNAKQFQGIKIDEDVHVEYIISALGGTEAQGGLARNKPTFVNLKQPNLLAFAKVAKALENTGTGAYLGALKFIDNLDYVQAAGSVALIEARHSGYLNVLFDLESTTNLFGQGQEFERAFTIDEVLASAGPLVVSLNSSIPLGFSTNVNDKGFANDVAIFNFALALEYLEKEFYDINVPIFFP